MRWVAVLLALLLAFAAVSFALPAHATVVFSGGSGTASDPYLLSTATDLRQMRILFDQSEAFAAQMPYFRLTASIRLNQGLGDLFYWQPVARFTGDLDGCGYTITGMYVPADRAVALQSGVALGSGLIGELAPGARVHGLTLSGCVEAPAGSGLLLAGGLACVNLGEIADCTSYVTIAVTQAVKNLQSSGIAATGTGRLARCVDRSHFCIYPGVQKRTSKIRFTGLLGDPAATGGAQLTACVDESHDLGTVYPSAWNLFEPTPTPQPTASPTTSLTPLPTATPTLARSPTPPPSPTPYYPPLAAAPPAAATPDNESLPQEAGIALQGKASSGGSQPTAKSAGDYQYTLNPDGRSVTLTGYLGTEPCVSVPDTLGGLPVSQIGSNAFGGNAALLELSLPDGVAALAADALINLSNLYRLHLPTALHVLPLSALAGCSRLLWLDMPTQVASISGSFPIESQRVTAWTGANPLAAAYCTAHGLTVREGIADSRQTETVEQITLRFAPSDAQTLRTLYAQQLGRAVEADADIDYSLSGFHWQDAFFSHPATEYDHTLAQLSLGLSVAAFRSTDGSQGGSMHDRNIVSALMEIGFRDIRTADYLSVAESTVPSAIASKRMLLGGQPVTVVALVLGGGESVSINISHTNPGQQDHNGFSAAADAVYARLAAYVCDHGLPGTPWKLWVTGFGSGGAIGNLLASRCAGVLLPASDCYGYHFANPGVAKGAGDAQASGGLYNIVNACDLLVAMPPATWGYQRRGTSLALPSAGIGAQAYPLAYDAMAAVVQRIRTGVVSGEALFPFLRLVGEGDLRLLTVARLMQRLMAYVLPTEALYDAQYYPLLAAHWQKEEGWQQCARYALRLMTDAPLLQLAQHSPSLSLVGVLDACYRSRAFGATRKALMAVLAQPEALPAYPAVASVLRCEASEDALLNTSEITNCLLPALDEATALLVSMHSPELYLGFMMSTQQADLTLIKP